MLQIQQGKFTKIRQCPSPNFNTRPADNCINMIVIHNISLPAGQFGNRYIDDLFCNRLDNKAHISFKKLAGLQVSSHLLIERNGQAVQYVNFDKRAWHAGQSDYQGQNNCNDFSIGIELEGTDDLAYTDAQYQQLIPIINCLQKTYPAIIKTRIVGHNTIAPQRKTDPGAAFDWQRLLSQLSQQ